jgi:hypothetical protein
MPEFVFVLESIIVNPPTFSKENMSLAPRSSISSQLRKGTVNLAVKFVLVKSI